MEVVSNMVKKGSSLISLTVNFKVKQVEGTNLIKSARLINIQLLEIEACQGTKAMLIGFRT